MTAGKSQYWAGSSLRPEKRKAGREIECFVGGENSMYGSFCLPAEVSLQLAKMKGWPRNRMLRGRLKVNIRSVYCALLLRFPGKRLASRKTECLRGRVEVDIVGSLQGTNVSFLLGGGPIYDIQKNSRPAFQPNGR